MTDHDADNMNDPIASALDAAGQRLRQRAPDAVASHQALRKVEQRADEPSPRPRSWWPALIGAGLAAAAVVGVIAIQTDNSDTLSPVQTNPEIAPPPTVTSTPEPSTTLVPTTTLVPSTTGSGATAAFDGPCITVTVGESKATGCPRTGVEFALLEQRVFVADLDGAVIVTSGSADPFHDLTAAVDNGDFASRCQWDDLAARIPAGGLVEVVVCDDTGVMGLDVEGLVTNRSDGDSRSTQYFTLPTAYVPEGAELGLGTPVDGLSGAMAFTTQVQDVTTCSILLLPDRSGWKEACGFIHGLDLDTALVQIDPADPSLYEISVDDSGLITSAQALDVMAPSSGCSIDSANDLARAMPASSILMGIGCIDDKASLTTGSVLTQQGPPDGSIRLALRDEAGVWSITDNGTGIDNAFSFPIAPMAVWENWPGSTVARFRSYWWEPIVAIPTQPTVEALADELLATLGPLDTDPEWPLNERLVEMQPAGLPLIIAQVDLGGDDSVVGAVFYVWLDEVFDDSGPIGWRASYLLGGDVCGRADSTGREICI